MRVRNLRDPIHGNILLEDWAIDLLDTPAVQRLRRIRQLGTAYLVYPGANHTRFEHSLGAYKLAQDATRALRLDESEARPVQAAALLHDVGHGPMSHLFEEALGPEHPHHEEFSRDLVQWSSIADRLKRAGIEPHRVASLIDGQGEYGRIVSGDIDVDRMDYLVRDAHYTGLRVSVDPERLLAVMELREGHFVVREEGLTAAEALLVARFLMYPAVYFHHTCRAGETMLVAAIRAWRAEGARPEDLRLLDDAGLLSALKAGPALARDVAERIEERRLFKRAFEGTHRAAESDAFLEGLLRDPQEARRVERELAAACALDPGYVLIDVPPQPLPGEVEARLLRKDGAIVPLREASTLIRSLLEAQRDHWRFWVFAPKESRERVATEFLRLLEPKSVKGSARIAPSP